MLNLDIFFETPNNLLLKFPRYTRITQFHPIPSGRGTFAGTNSWKAKLNELATMTKAGSLVTGAAGRQMLRFYHSAPYE